jgi:hypothetical protein
MDSEEFKDENPVDPIDLSIFRENIENNLLRILESLPKFKKTIILDISSISKLNFVTTLEKLKTANVQKELILKSGRIMVETPILVYLIPPKKECVQIIEKHIESNNKNLTQGMDNNIEEGKIDESKANKEYHIIFFPKITNECQSLINDSLYRAYFNVYNLNMDIFPLDYEIMSLQDDNSFHQLYVTNNYNSLFLLNRAIIKYETVFGKIKHKYYKGDLAKKLKEMLCEEESNVNLEEEPKTLACIMMDRTIDMITPIITNHVYEALLDDNFGIDFNIIKVSPKLLEKDVKAESIKLDLSKNDKFYTKIKDYSFNQIRSYLPARLQEHNKIIDETKKKTRDLSKIQADLENVSKIKEERASLTNHINLADFISKKERLPITRFYYMYEQGLLFGDLPDKIQEFIFDEIRKKSDEYDILKIICLYSIVQGGFKSKIYDQLRKEFFIVYGFQELFMWRNLEKLRVLKAADNQNFYSSLNKKLNLMSEEEFDSKEQKDASYVYNGFCPIIIRLLEKLVEKGWGSIKDILKELPGEMGLPDEENEIISQKTEKQFILLVFIGGITYGELAGIRYLNKKIRNKKFIILTTNIINTKKMFDSLKQGKYTYVPIDPNDKSNYVLTFKEAYNQSK